MGSRGRGRRFAVILAVCHRTAQRASRLDFKLYHYLGKLNLSAADIQAIEHGNAARLIPRLKA
jgi:hypothetical protein